jgi:hypothetical protein
MLYLNLMQAGCGSPGPGAAGDLVDAVLAGVARRA